MYTASKTCIEQRKIVGLYDDEQVKIAGFVGSFRGVKPRDVSMLLNLSFIDANWLGKPRGLY